MQVSTRDDASELETSTQVWLSSIDSIQVSPVSEIVKSYPGAFFKSIPYFVITEKYTLKSFYATKIAWKFQALDGNVKVIPNVDCK